MTDRFGYNEEDELVDDEFGRDLDLDSEIDDEEDDFYVEGSDESESDDEESEIDWGLETDEPELTDEEVDGIIEFFERNDP